MAAAGGKINVDALTRKIEGKLSDKKLSPQCSIFKIPAILLRHNKNAYQPNAFSIGPFHHGKENLNASETIKAKYLHDLISRLPSPHNDQNPAQTRTLWVKKFIEAISANWEEARQYYGGPIGMEEDQFVEVLVLDGCFIVELLRRHAYEDLREENDPIFSTYFLLQYLWHDLILLENQIPWMVLDILFNLTRSTFLDEKPLVQLAIEFFRNIFSTQSTSYVPLLSHPNKHILDLLRNSLVLNSSMLGNRYNLELDSYELKPLRSATSLEDSGIKFKMGTSESILDIKFNRKEGVLEIPTLFIQENITETLFGNLICLEKVCLNYRGIITSYAMLLNNLMQTTTDLKILHESGVIDNRIKHLEGAIRIFEDSHEEPGAATFTSYYLGLAAEVEEYSRRRTDYYIRRWGAYKRVLKQTYFSHPWAAISTIGASVLLVLTFLQTIFTIIQK